MRVLCLSDTHSYHKDLEVPKKGYTCAVHTGDWSNRGSELETDDFLVWFSELPCKHKILVAGNHDWYAYSHNNHLKTKCALLGITYLQDEEVVINGIKFYGTPWVNKFYDWAFMKYESDLTKVYNKIPDDTNVLLTHGPALYILDEVPRGHVGSAALAERIKELKDLEVHMCGHIHESWGDIKTDGYRALNNAVLGAWNHLRTPRVINIRNR